LCDEENFLAGIVEKDVDEESRKMAIQSLMLMEKIVQKVKSPSLRPCIA